MAQLLNPLDDKCLSIMDDVVEKGFERLEVIIAETKDKQKELAEEVKQKASELLAKMAASVGLVVQEIGQEFLQRAKVDQKGELYDQVYYPDKMIILGKSATPEAFRPDNPTKKVTNQYCVLSAAGNLFELMYSNDGFIIDTYASPLTPEDAIYFYGYDIIYMLYGAMRDYALAQQDLIDAINITLGYIQGTIKE